MSGLPDRSVYPAEVLQLSVSEEEISPEQKSDSSLNQEITEPPQIKEEPEDLWSSQEGEQLHGPENADIIKLTFVPVPVKVEEDEEKPQSAHLYQRQTEEMETETDGADFGKSGSAMYSDPERDLKPETGVKSEDSSEAETDDSADWGEATELHFSCGGPADFSA
ncbi:uncharacterized protein LOC121523789 isoform X3 [Cheilinus undulatus]|uniref:uncharacterized protein LOC121523789 isoform X3 n=1 Tax=Cheilinus undulatus TaxID=241271 RepID=UPI001BD2C2A9|nr:uncharacterized protein LOC121523789 isoform X3 [Cheilinus undulatus]